MIQAEGRRRVITIAATRRQVLEWILDLDRYRAADGKITQVDHQPSITPDERTGPARYRGRLRGLPTPSQWQTVTLEPWTKWELETEPGQWTSRLALFEGGFECEPLADDMTRLRHYERFRFKMGEAVLRRFLERWMQRYMDDVELPKLEGTHRERNSVRFSRESLCDSSRTVPPAEYDRETP